jgi:hypothetical protein
MTKRSGLESGDRNQKWTQSTQCLLTQLAEKWKLIARTQHTVQQDGAGITIDYIHKSPSDDASLKKKVLVAALEIATQHLAAPLARLIHRSCLLPDGTLRKVANELSIQEYITTLLATVKSALSWKDTKGYQTSQFSMDVGGPAYKVQVQTESGGCDGRKEWDSANGGSGVDLQVRARCMWRNGGCHRLLPKLSPSAQVLVQVVTQGGELADFATGGIELKLRDTGAEHEEQQIQKQAFCKKGYYQGFAFSECSH